MLSQISEVHEAGICGRCLDLVEKCYEFVNEIRAYDKHVFGQMRKEYAKDSRDRLAMRSGNLSDLSMPRLQKP